MGTCKIGTYTFDIDPSTASWGYNIRTSKQQTQGGTVIQVLRTDIDDLVITGYLSARGLTHNTRRERIRDLELKMKKLMQHSVDSGESLQFYFPILGWNGKVFIQNIDGFTYNPSTVAFSYRISMFVDTGFDTIKTVASRDDLNAIADGVGWTRNKYNQPNLEDWEDMLTALKQIVENSGSYDAYGVSLYEQLQKIRENDDPVSSNSDSVIYVSTSGGTSSLIEQKLGLPLYSLAQY